MGKKLKRILKAYSSIITSNISLFLAVGCLNILISGSSMVPDHGVAVFDVLRGLAALLYHQVIPLVLACTAGMRSFGADEKNASMGRVAAAVAACGLIAAEVSGGIFWSVPVGFFAGILAERGNRRLQGGSIPAGFEMIARNILTAGAGLLTAAAVVLFVSPLAAWFDRMLSPVLDGVIGSRFLFLSSVLVEPLKLLFLNNGLNHGLLVPLGMEQLEHMGKSIFFLLETNPGPGFGVLAGYWLVRRPKRRDFAAEMVIELFGGIHEVYFPYVLAHVSLFPAVIAGGVCGSAVFQLLHVGLAGPVSPGSILGLLFMGKLSDWPGILLGVGSSAFVSFLLSVWALRRIEKKKEAEAEEMREEAQNLGPEPNPEQRQAEETKQMQPEQQAPKSCLRHIYVVCDAGLGSSAMGAALLRRKLKAAGFSETKVLAAAFDDLPPDGDLLICQTDFFEQRLKGQEQLPETVQLERLTDGAAYEAFLERFRARLM